MPASSHTYETIAKLLILSPLMAALLSLILRKRNRRWQDRVSMVASLVALGLALALASNPVLEKPIQFRFLWFIPFYLDALSVYFVLLVNAVALWASLYLGAYLDLQQRLSAGKNIHPALFHLFFNLFHFTMILVPLVDNLVVLWIAVELTTLASAYLVGYQQDRPALEAAWKYIVITSTGIIFALLGTLFLGNALPPGESSMNWSELVVVADQFDQNFIKLSFLFILVGYGTKAGLAPMYTWLPDGHGEAPFPISALLSGVLLKSALYAILRFYTLTNITLHDGGAFTSGILLAAGLFSLVLATPFILKDNRFKRVLAYHSLEHMGIITFGLGIGGTVAMFGALLHALNHAFTKALMFLTFGNVQANYANSRLFCLGDLKNPASLLAKLDHPADPLTHYLRDRLSPATRRQLAQPPTEQLQQKVVDYLNQLLRGPCLYDESRFENIPLKKSTRQLIPGEAQPGEYIGLNRLLLEEAFPDELAPSQAESHYVGILRAMPGTGTLLALGGLALVGSPPFNIFFSEFIILWAAITKSMAQPSIWLIGSIVFFLLSITLIFGGLVYHLGRMLIGHAPGDTARETAGQVLPLIILLGLVILFGFTVPKLGPLDLSQLLHQSVRVVCGATTCQ